MNKTRNYRERKQESISMNILHVIFDTKEMYEKAKTHFDSDGPSPFWAGDWNDETRTIEFAEANSVDTLEVALTADMESAGIEGYHFELADTMELEPEEDKELLVLCSTDEENTKECYLTISREDLKAGIHNERIVSELRKIFCVEDYVAQVGDEGEQEFQEAVESLLQGRDAAFECYEWYWETVLAL